MKTEEKEETIGVSLKIKKSLKKRVMVCSSFETTQKGEKVTENAFCEEALEAACQKTEKEIEKQKGGRK